MPHEEKPACVGLCYLNKLRGLQVLTEPKKRKPCIGLCYLAKLGKIKSEQANEEEDDYEEEEAEEVLENCGDDYAEDYEEEYEDKQAHESLAAAMSLNSIVTS